MNNIDYLLKYVTNEDFNKILTIYSDYKEDLHNNRIDVDLNIRYLIKYGITNISQVIVKMLDDLLLPHNDFIKKINNYEQNLGKNQTIIMLENI